MTRRREAARHLAHRLLPFAAALFLLAAVRLALWLAPYRVVAPWLPVARGAAPDWKVRRILSAVRRAAILVPGATCLPQAVTAHMLCALIGHASLIRIGVRRDAAGRIMAHAWLVDGQERILLGAQGVGIDGFTPLIDLQPGTGR